MTKYGGPGRMKQTCEKRRCLHPQLPVCAHCSICNLDGWFNTPKVQGKEAERPEEPPNLCKSDSSYNLYFRSLTDINMGLVFLKYKTLYNIREASRHLMMFLLLKTYFRYGHFTSLMFLFISVSCHLSRQNAVLQI